MYSLGTTKIIILELSAKVKGGKDDMEPKTTEDLNLELMQNNSIGSYIRDNQALFLDTGVTEALSALWEKSSITKNALAYRAGMSEVYLHQVFSDRRSPSRNRLLCLCVALEAGLDETQTLLRRAGYAQLDPKVKRDAVVSHGILHHTPLEEINDNLFEENEKTLY